MRTIRLIAGMLLTGALALSLGSCSQSEGRTETRIDKDWLFYKGDYQNAQQAELDDSGWRKLNIPHDWSIEGEYDQANTTGFGGGYRPFGVAWYRKHISIPSSYKGHKVYLEFEGIMENGSVWLNGELLGERPYGYSGTFYDVTDLLLYGKKNVIAVKADTKNQPASRWYTGAGLYRHVNLIVTDMVHFDNLGVFVHADQVSAQSALVEIESDILNESEKDMSLSVAVTMKSPAGKTFTSTSDVSLRAGSATHNVQEITVDSPELWDVDDPNLYDVTVELVADGRTIDNTQLRTGIRQIEWRADTGFWLNGRKVRIQGLCMHHDGGPLGAAVTRSSLERRMRNMKAMGGNAIRTAHNPMDKTFFEVCDEMGVLVMSEAFDCWEVRKNPYDYARVFKEWWERDLGDLILRSRNHASVIIYSIGNEIHDPLNAPESFEKFTNLRDLCHQIDPSRPVTMAVLRPNQWGVYDSGFSELFDVVGQNYRENEMVAAHEQMPSRIMIGTENNHNIDSWVAFRDHDFISGHFIWAGWQYLGESMWPNISFANCLFDRNSNITPLGWQRYSWWGDKPVVHITRVEKAMGIGMTDDWNPVGTEDQTLRIFTNCQEVLLSLNGSEVGRYQRHEDDSPIEVTLAPELGELVAVGYNNGTEAAKDVLKTASEPVGIVFEAESETITNDWDDIVYVNATVVDKDGLRYPTGEYELTFEVEGPADLVAVDNGCTFSHEMYVSDHRSTYKGKALAIIRANADSGTITVKVSNPELGQAEARISIVD